MIEIIPFSQTRENVIAPMDSCGKRSVAVIKAAAIMIPICEDCLNKMKRDLETLNNSTLQ